MNKELTKGKKGTRLARYPMILEMSSLSNPTKYYTVPGIGFLNLHRTINGRIRINVFYQINGRGYRFCFPQGILLDLLLRRNWLKKIQVNKWQRHKYWMNKEMKKCPKIKIIYGEKKDEESL